jgi:AcrR family transcriptional regulator
VSTRGERTREQILDAAELLYGDRGVDAVSLREIRLAANQRNTSAIQFHFGGADGLLVALAERHLPLLAARQVEVRARQVERGAEEPADLIDVLVLPWADYVERGPSERAWVKISAAESARPERFLRDFQHHLPEVMRQTVEQLYAHLVTFLPEPVAIERLLAVSMSTVHLCADRARAIDAAAGAARPLIEPEVFRANLLAMDRAAAFATSPELTAGGGPGRDAAVAGE